MFWCNSVVPRILGKFSGSKRRTHLIIFNLETNPNSEVLATNIYWIEEFAKHFKSIFLDISPKKNKINPHKHTIKEKI